MMADKDRLIPNIGHLLQIDKKGTRWYFAGVVAQLVALGRSGLCIRSSQVRVPPKATVGSQSGIRPNHSTTTTTILKVTEYRRYSVDNG